MSRSDWYISDEVGRAIAALAAGDAVDGELLGRPEANRLAYRHGLAVPAARALDPASPRGRYMWAVAARMAARQSCIDTHLRRILERLTAADVRVSVVKGPVVASRYLDPSIRTYTDVDLIVPREDLSQALSELGNYEAIGAIPAKGPAADKRDIVVRDPTGVQFTVDLHWDLFSFHQLGGVADAAMGEAWAAARFDADHPVGPMWLLPEPVVISFLSLHALLDHRFRLILFRDLKEWAAGGLDWPALVRFAEVHGVAQFNYLAWLIAANVAGAEPPEWLMGRLRRGNWLERVAESHLGRVDLVRFDGHRVHPLNLALALAHDQPAERRRLVRKAPLAYPGWHRRVQEQALSASNTVDILVTSNARRGAEVVGRALADELVFRGWDASLVSLCGGEEPHVETTPIVGSAVSLRGLRLGVLGGLRRRFRAQRPAVVFANGGATLRYAVAAALLTRGRPRLIYGSIGEPGFWLRGAVHRLLQRLLIAACDQVTAVSEATARALTSDLGVDPAKITVVHPGVADHWFDLMPRTRRDGPLRILFAGRLSYEKNPLLAVEVAARLEGKVALRIAGDGPLRARVEKAAGGAVEVLGSVENLIDHMQWADVLLLTSLTEGLPGVVLEAAASGVPAVAADVGGIREVVVDGDTGFLVPSGDVDGFVEALSRLIDDDDMRSRMGQAARLRVGGAFRMADSVDAYETVLRGAAFR